MSNSKKQRYYFVHKGLSGQGYGFSSGHVWMWELDYQESRAPKNWCFWTVVLETWESLGLQGDPTCPSWRRSVLGVHWKDWCWSWNSNPLVTWSEELTHLKRPWCWEGLGAGGEGDDRGWDGWMASPTQWTWVWVDVGSWWWTGRPGVLPSMGSQKVRHDWATELNWTELVQLFYDPMDCSPPGSCLHGILQARILEWVAIPFSGCTFWLRNQNQILKVDSLPSWAIQEAPIDRQISNTR